MDTTPPAAGEKRLACRAFDTSLTLTVNEARATFCPRSVPVHSTLVAPTRNSVDDAGVQTGTIEPSTTSVAEAANLTTAPFLFEVRAVTAAGTTTLGAVRSTTVIRKVLVTLSSGRSWAVHVTVVCPSGKLAPELGLQETGSDWLSRPVAEVANETAAPFGACASTVMSAGTVSSGSRVGAADDVPTAPVRASSATGTTTPARLILPRFSTGDGGIWINRRMELKGEGVVLRAWRMEDAPAVAEACQDPEIARWLAFVPQPYKPADARRYIQDCIEASDDRRPFAITDAKTGVLIGSIDMRITRLGAGHIGYWMTPEARGRGRTTAALRALSRWAIEELGLGRVELATDLDNIASQRVAEKAGFQREGVLRAMLPTRDGPRRDGVMFSLLPGELD